MYGFDIKLTGRGWVEAIIYGDQKNIIIEASYLSDAIKDMIDCVVLLLLGQQTTSCRWEDEPGEFRWIFQRTGSDVNISVLRFKEEFSDEENEAGNNIFYVDFDLLFFCRKLRSTMEDLYIEYGEEGYYKEWGYEYPKMSIYKTN